MQIKITVITEAKRKLSEKEKAKGEGNNSFFCEVFFHTTVSSNNGLAQVALGKSSTKNK